MLRSKLLRELYQQHTLSRADLTRLTGASSASVTQIIRELLDEGVVQEQGSQQEGLGRPRVMLCIQQDFRCVVGIRMVSQEIHASLMNLRGHSLCQLTHHLTSFEPHQVTAELAEVVHKLILQGGISKDKLLGVGLALSGIVDARQNLCVYSFLLGWKHVPIGEMLEKRLSVPVRVDNDVNSITIAQKLFSEMRLERYFTVLYIGEGIGAGFYHDDELLTGRNNAAGEIGHFTVVRNGRLCICGKRGCLQAYASTDSLLHQAREQGLDIETLEDLHHAALQGDPEVLRLLNFAGQLVGLALSYVIDTLDIQKVIVYAPTCNTERTFQNALLEAVHHHSLPLVDSPKTILFKPGEPELWLAGAGGIAINAFLNDQLKLPLTASVHER
ncbi:ROK family transcriptional regulator [Deinococcus cellulosilyticus]|uniref:ROK family protein n=1 Tax=Deinococcus cellulosilyticus (strain DSM 18568 / NBRC 106333 / KACC 11606 / 5516J-15) TaxID=1223518 RepID=A0A511N663_DEIC1|nr:ROK family transcriptional regulator [Deinococcus cellulosilyticus]GEM48334.1 ROK family protein [Deinococcus cellulosilyticus NBRC 106333 = KACC 11606]